MQPWFVLTVLFLFGAVIGSFLNVCIARLPHGVSVIRPGSHCMSCKKPIPFYYNIPVLSYLYLGGKCAFCKTPIAFHHYAVELLTPFVLILCYLFFGAGLQGLISFVFAAALIVVVFIDLEHRIIPDVITLPGILFFLLVSFFEVSIGWKDALIGILAGGGVLYAFAAGYQLLTGREGMGGGDIKLLAMIGAFLGWQGAVCSLMTGAFMGSIIGVVMMTAKGKDMKYAIPFGPFLSAGAYISLFFGREYLYQYIPFAA